MVLRQETNGKNWPGDWLVCSQDGLDYAAITNTIRIPMAYQNVISFLFMQLLPWVSM